MNNSHSKSIKSLIEKSFIFASTIIMVISSISALYFNQFSMQERRENNSQKTHEIFSQLIIPDLSISNVTQIRGLLQLISSAQETFVVIDNNGSILMPDYENIYLVKSVLNYPDTHLNCNNLHTIYKKINHVGYWINCSHLKQETIFSNNHLGFLLSFTKNESVFFSSIIIYFICISLVTIFLLLIWFRQIIHRKLLKPLITLGNHIDNKARAPLTVDAMINDLGEIPYEIYTIKKAFEAVLMNLQTEYKQRTESQKKAILFDFAAQVAHDIRSPLAVMQMMLNFALFESRKEKDIFTQAIQRVRDIANNLIGQYRTPLENTLISAHKESATILFFPCSQIEQMISQKIHEWNGHPCEICFDVDNSHIKFLSIVASPIEFNRVLSNILNNAYEALRDKRTIKLKLTLTRNILTLMISDSGIGIPENKLASVLNGESLKHTGNGLGLSHAKQFMREAHGYLELQSNVNRGTLVSLSFTQFFRPSWLPTKISFPEDHQIIIIDDDDFIHSTWQHTLNKKMYHFINSDDFFKWFSTMMSEEKFILLVDYELRNSTLNGLEILHKVNLRRNSYLITSHAEETEIQQKAVQLGIWLIPKLLLGEIEIDSLP